MKNSQNNSVPSETTKNNSWLVQILLVVFGVTMLWFSIVSSWVTGNIFNEKVFVAAVSNALQSDRTRIAVSEGVINRLLAGYPLIRRAAGPTLTNTVSGILQSSQFQPVYDKAARQVFIQLTTPNPKPVEIDFQNAFTFVMPILEKLNPQLASKLDGLPQKVTVIEPGQLPSLYRLGAFLGFFGPIAGVAGLVIIGVLLYKASGIEQKLKLVVWGALSFSAFAFIFHLMVPTVELWLLARIPTETAGIIVSQVFDNLLGSFLQLSETVMILGFVVAGGTFVFLKFFLKKKISQ